MLDLMIIRGLGEEAALSKHSELVASVATSPMAAVQSALGASWARSMNNYGLDPAASARMHRATQPEISAHLEASSELLDVARRELTQLFQLVGQPGCGLFLVDTDGIVLDRRVVDADTSAFENLGLDIGAVCNEQTEGTNGMGTCIAEQRPVVIHRDEHFLERNTQFTCIGVPIFGAQGEVVAALDLSTGRDDHTKAANRLLSYALMQTSRRIEERFFRSRYPSARFLVTDVENTDASGMLAIDGDDLVIGANRAARIAFDLGCGREFDAVPAASLVQQSGAGRDMGAVSRSAIIRALTRSSWNMSAAARQLGIGRTTLYRRMKQLDIQK